MAGIKIVDLPALGRDLISTDLLELSLAGGTGSRKITGQEIMNASKLSVGNTPIINGAVGQVLFQGTGNVLQESANLFWDDTNGRLGIGTSTPANRLEVQSGDVRFANALTIGTVGSTGWQFSSNTLKIIQNGFIILDTANNRELLIINQALTTTFLNIKPTGNVLINTTTDAGFRLDVNGTARVQGNTTVTGTIGIGSAGFLSLSGTINSSFIEGNQSIEYRSKGTSAQRRYHNFTNINVFNPTNDFIQHVAMGASFSPTSGTGTYAQLYLTPTINQTGGANGITRGLYINPTLTSAFDFRAIETTAGNVIFNGGNVGIGTSSPTVPIHGLVNNQNIVARFEATGTGEGNIEMSGVAPQLRATTTNGASGFRVSIFGSTTGDVFRLQDSTTTLINVKKTGNVLINTTTDAGFKLDVNGTARFTGRIDAGTFTPGAGATAYTIATTGRISAGNGISFRSPVTGDSIFVGFSPVGSGQIEAYTGSTRVFVLGGAGADLGSMATATPNFNPSSGTGNKSIFAINGVYNTTGTFSGTIKGFYYNPTLTSMTGVTSHHAFHSTSGRVRFEGLPTSPTGLNAGDIYNDGGTLKIV